MRYVGPHVSAAGAPAAAIANAQAVGATAFALFVKNQRQWVGKPLTEKEITDFKCAMHNAGYQPQHILPHAGYLINLANPKEEMYEKSMGSFLDELTRCEKLGLSRLNLHPGSHLKLISVEAACDRVAESINIALDQTSGVTVVIENTAGQGAYLGSKFEELQRIYAGVNDKSRIGFCLDTAHSLAAGFDLRTIEGVDSFLEQFDAIVGLSLLRGMHINDSKGTIGSHLDRHASFGEGQLGWEPILHLVRHPALQTIPLILETPDPDRWPEETRRLLEA